MGSCPSQNAPQRSPFEQPEFPQFVHWQQIGHGFWHLRWPFLLKKGPVSIDIKTHMSVCRLESGDFVCIDCVVLSEEAKAELDLLTDHGQKIVGVINTHPFHTKAIPVFHSQYPSSKNRRWFGCPRHLKMFPYSKMRPIEWAGDLNTCEARSFFEPDISMRIPAGAEFVDPKPPSSNHFSTVFVLHRESKALHVDDCLMYFDQPSMLMRVAGKSANTMEFHMSMPGALHPTAQAPLEFKEWLTQLCDDWDFEHVLTAHIGNCYCCGKLQVKQCLKNADRKLTQLAAANAAKKPRPDISEASYSDDPGQTECG